jgi:hypothetical protein
MLITPGAGAKRSPIFAEILAWIDPGMDNGTYAVQSAVQAMKGAAQ